MYEKKMFRRMKMHKLFIKNKAIAKYHLINKAAVF